MGTIQPQGVTDLFPDMPKTAPGGGKARRATKKGAGAGKQPASAKQANSEASNIERGDTIIFNGAMLRRYRPVYQPISGEITHFYPLKDGQSVAKKYLGARHVDKIVVPGRPDIDNLWGYSFIPFPISIHSQVAKLLYDPVNRCAGKQWYNPETECFEDVPDGAEVWFMNASGVVTLPYDHPLAVERWMACNPPVDLQP